MRRLRWALGLITIMVMALAACGGGGGGQKDAGTFRILFVGGITGPQSSVIAVGVDGMKAAVDSINAAGGIAGRKVELDARDSQGDPTKAVSVLTEALNGANRPDVVVPSQVSTEALAMVPLLTRQKILSVGYAASPALNNPAKYPYHYQVSSNSSKQFVGLKSYLKSKGVTKLGVLTSQDAYGNGVVTAAKEALDGSGIEVVSQQFPPADVDLSVSYSRILAARPGTVLVDTTGDPAPRVLQARVKAGGTQIPTIIGTGMLSTGQGPYAYGGPQANANASYLIFGVMRYLPESQRTATFNDFYRRLSALGPINQPLSSPALAWDNIRLIAAAANKPGATKSLQTMQAALQSLSEPAGYWLTQQQFIYTPQNHSPTPTANDFPIVPAGPLENGLVHSTTS